MWAGALVAWAAALGLVATGDGGALGAAWSWPAAAGLLLAWTFASTLWSAVPSQSLLDTRPLLVYAAVVLALVVLARAGAAWALVVGTELGICVLVGWALARYLLRRGAFDQFEGYHLSQPVGYANGIGILAVLGALLALGPTLAACSRVARAAAAASVPLLLEALVFTGSNASFAALGAGILATAACARSPLAVLRAVGLLAVPTLPLLWLAHWSRYADADHPRTGGGVLLAAGLAAALIAAAVPFVQARLGAVRRPRPVVPLLVAAAVAAVAVAVALGGSTQPRRSYYHVAWHELVAHPLLGSGAGTFARAWLDSGLAAHYGGALNAHSLYLETLAELGPLGLALLLVVLFLPLRRLGRVRDVRGVPAAFGAAVAFLLHAGVDWDWQLPAVVVAGLACLGAVLLADGEWPPAGPRLRGGALVAALALGGLSIAGTADSAEPSAVAGPDRLGA